jgi:hypothetical protein
MSDTTQLSAALLEAFDILDQVTRDLTPEQYTWQPEGTANPISKLHAHTLGSVDFWMNLMAQGKPMLWSAMSARTGMPSNFIEVWQAAEPIKLADMQAYAAELVAAVPAIESLDEAALQRELRTPVFGRRTVAFVLRLSAWQLAAHTGEISAAKGLQGLQGLPF